MLDCPHRPAEPALPGGPALQPRTGDSPTQNDSVVHVHYPAGHAGRVVGTCARTSGAHRIRSSSSYGTSLAGGAVEVKLR